MEAPPSYIPPRKQTNWALIIGLIVGGIFLCCLLPAGLLGGAGLYFWGKVKDTGACGIAFEDMQQSLRNYAHDHKGALPKAGTWMDDVRPYYQKLLESPEAQGRKFVGTMDVTKPFSCTTDKRVTGMAFNKDLSGKKIDDIKDQGTIMIFETDEIGQNLSAKYVQKDMASSPQVFNKPRGWFSATVGGRTFAGNSRFNASASGTGVNVEVEPSGESK
jgi:hypothetical protein